MGIWQSVVLGVVQGFGEFLPISSSAHLVLVPWLFGWDYKGLNYDVALHLGTLAAVLFYFRRDFLSSFHHVRRAPTGIFTYGRLWKLGLATIPAAIAGILLEKTAEHVLRGPVWMAVNLMLFALLLAAADRLKKRSRDLALSRWQFFVVGCAQALSIMPGVSRSGITITVALFLGTSRSQAARISFLLSVPVILGAGALEVRQMDFSAMGWDYAAGFLSAAISGWVAISFVMDYVRRSSYTVFVLYRLALGAFILWYAALR